MAVPVWPASLPQFALQEGYAEGFKDTTLRSPTDSGATKRRQRFTNAPTTLDVTVVMTDAELATFKTFFEDDLANGTLSFDYPHPRLATTVTVAFTEPPEPLTSEGGATYVVRMRLEIQV